MIDKKEILKLAELRTAVMHTTDSKLAKKIVDVLGYAQNKIEIVAEISKIPEVGDYALNRLIEKKDYYNILKVAESTQDKKRALKALESLIEAKAWEHVKDVASIGNTEH